jgi:hypothetical protein
MLARPALPDCMADGEAALRLLQLLAALFALMLLSADAPAAAEEESEKPNANSSSAGKCRD